MRDLDRIDIYYRFGTSDWRSEEETSQKNRKMLTYSPVRYFKLASLLWSLALRNIAPGGSKKKL